MSSLRRVTASAETTTDQPQAGQSERQPSTTARRILASAVLTQLMIVLDMTIVAIALPQLQSELGLTSDQQPWVVTAYTLAFGGLILFGGRLLAFLGPRRAFIVGIVGFALASLAGGLAPNFAVLVGARAVQGAFGALLAPTNLAVVNLTFTQPAARARAFALLGSTGGAGAAIRLMLGGVLTEALDWRWAFYINLFIAAAALVVAGRHLPTVIIGRVRLADDLLGLVWGCLGVFALVYGLSEAQRTAWGEPTTVVLLASSVILLGAFVIRERVAARPVLPLWILQDVDRGSSYLVMLATGFVQMGCIVYLTYYFQGQLGYSPLITGVAFLPLVGGLIVAAIAATRVLVPRFGTKVIFPLGFAIQGVGLWLLTGLSDDSTYTEPTLIALILVGFGMGMVAPAAFNAGTRGVPGEYSGLASAMLNAAQQIGSSFGVALLSTVAAHTASDWFVTHQEDLTSKVTSALTSAGAAPDSVHGQEIITGITVTAQNSAQIDAYASGFTVAAWGLAGAVIVLIGIGLLGVRRRARTSSVAVDIS